MFKIFSILISIFFASSALAQETNNLKTILPGDKVLGQREAKVTLIEYASLSCPHCKEFHTDILPTIKKEFIDTGKVRLIFRDFPLNASALAASQISQCIGKTGDYKYYEALKTLFAKQASWAFSKDYKQRLADITKELGLDQAAFDACLGNKDLETQILQGTKDASDQLKIDATPSFLVNGEKAQIHSIEDARKAFSTVLSGKTLEQEAKEEAQNVLGVKKSDNVLGKDTAKVTIIEYSNIGCPHCAQFHEMVVSALKKDYIDTGKARLVFREFPMTEGTFYAYMVARCQGADNYFKTLSVLIDEVQQWAVTQAFIKPLRVAAEKAGISRDAYYACLESKSAEALVLENLKDATQTLGIEHSPTIYINGEVPKNFNSPEDIRKAVDEALADKD